MGVKPYVGQAWKRDLAGHAIFFLELIAGDLAQALRDNGGVDVIGPPELWENDSQDSKGLFLGDTSN
jgi:hypothetical protein